MLAVEFNEPGDALGLGGAGRQRKHVQSHEQNG
jgi:hypothetical protein